MCWGLRWLALYRGLEAGLAHVPGLTLIARHAEEELVGSSFQFRLPQWEGARVAALVARCLARGVELKWFGAADPVAFTSRYSHWAYANPPVLPQTDRVLAGLIDMRVPLTFSLQDVAQIARIIRAEVLVVGQADNPDMPAVCGGD